jgi:hypothetical protein
MKILRATCSADNSTQTVEELNLLYTTAISEGKEINPEFVSPLKTLDLANVNKLRGPFLSFAGVHLIELESLNLFNCWKINDQNFLEFATVCSTKLIDICVRGCVKLTYVT